MLLIQFSCTAEIQSDLSKAAIIPKPVSITATGSFFEISESTCIYVQGESGELNQLGQYLADRLKPATGFEIFVKSTTRQPGSGNIYLIISGSATKPGDESYELLITKKSLKLTAANPAGLFRGIQTIRQLLPPAIENNSKQTGPWNIPTGTITDYPVYSYRGGMLDVAPSFFWCG